MGGIVMIEGIIILLMLSIVIIVCFALNVSKECNEDRGVRAGTCFFAIVASIILGVVIKDITTPTIEEYVHGKVRVEINQVYENGEVVICDTNYYKL